MGEMFTKGESLGTGDFLEWSIKVNLSSKGDILYRLKMLMEVMFILVVKVVLMLIIQVLEVIYK